jgi:hypothetical protein
MKVQKYEVQYFDRQPRNVLVDVVDNIPCRITGTHNENIKLFVLKKYYDVIPEGLHKNFVITVEDNLIQNYTIVREPIWSGGVHRHIECILEETK